MMVLKLGNVLKIWAALLLVGLPLSVGARTFDGNLLYAEMFDSKSYALVFTKNDGTYVKVDGKNYLPFKNVNTDLKYFEYSTSGSFRFTYRQGNFRPNDPITMAEAVKVISNTNGW